MRNEELFLIYFNENQRIDIIQRTLNKLENKGVFIENYCHYYPDLGDFITTDNNTVVRVWYNDAITVFKNEIENDENKRKNYPSGVFETLMQYNEEDDNPILIFYEFQDN